MKILGKILIVIGFALIYIVISFVLFDVNVVYGIEFNVALAIIWIGYILKTSTEWEHDNQENCN